MNEMGHDSSLASDTFTRAFESILESLGDEFSRRKKKIVHEEQKNINSLHKMISNHINANRDRCFFIVYLVF